MQGQMAVMDHTGDTKILWDSDSVDEVTSAKEQFEKLTKKGYVAFKTDKKGDKGEQIREFDPKAERIMLCRPMQGG